MTLTFNEIKEGMILDTKSFSLSEGAIRHHLKVYGREFGLHASDQEVPITLLLSTFAGNCFLKPVFSCREVRNVDVKVLKSIRVNEELTPETRVVRLLPETRVKENPVGYVFLETTFRNEAGEEVARSKCTVLVDQVRRTLELQQAV